MPQKLSAKAFRSEVQDLVDKFMDIFDPSGESRKRWDTEFNACKTDEDFVKYIKKILDNPKRYFTPEIAAYDKSKQPKFTNYRTLAKMVGIELEEVVALPYLNENTGITKPIVTNTKVPVGMLHLKRLQQIVRKKNKITINTDLRDSRNGQVTGKDKGGRITDADLYSLYTISATPVLKELYGPRADSADSNEALYDAIRGGTRLPRLSDLPNDINEKASINTLNNYILGASLISDLVSDSYILPITKMDVKKNRVYNNEEENK